MLPVLYFSLVVFSMLTVFFTTPTESKARKTGVMSASAVKSSGKIAGRVVVVVGEVGVAVDGQEVVAGVPSPSIDLSSSPRGA